MVDAVHPEYSHYKITAQSYQPLSLHCTSSGKLFLQYLSEPYRTLTINQLNYQPHTSKTITSAEDLITTLKEQEHRHYAIESEEQALGISSIAVPLFRKDGRFFGAVSLTTISQVLNEHIDIYSSALANTACQIEETLNKAIKGM